MTGAESGAVIQRLKGLDSQTVAREFVIVISVTAIWEVLFYIMSSESVTYLHTVAGFFVVFGGLVFATRILFHIMDYIAAAMLAGGPKSD